MASDGFGPEPSKTLAELIFESDFETVDDEAFDASHDADLELEDCLRGHGDPVVLSGDLAGRLRAYEPGTPAPLWTLCEPELVSHLEAMEAAAGADALVANARGPLGADASGESLDPEAVHEAACRSAAGAPAPYALGAAWAAGERALENLAPLSYALERHVVHGALVEGAPSVERACDVARRLAPAPVVAVLGPGCWPSGREELARALESLAEAGVVAAGPGPATAAEALAWARSTREAREGLSLGAAAVLADKRDSARALELFSAGFSVLGMGADSDLAQTLALSEARDRWAAGPQI